MLQENTPLAVCATPLNCATVSELIDEIRRRSLGCMIVCMRPEERGDAWQYALKGSPMLLGAMSAALTIKTNEKLAGEKGGEGDLQEV